MTQQQEQFLDELAEYLGGSNSAEMSVRLANTHDRDAERWQQLRCKTPLSGYPTKDEAKATLARFLGFE